MATFDIVKVKQSYWLIGTISVLLISLLVNQIVYVYNAALEQEAHFNDKANIALASIVDKVSENNQVCRTMNSCIKGGKVGFCSRSFKTKKEWHFVDSIVSRTLAKSNLDLNYNFDFCSSDLMATLIPDNKATYSKHVDNPLQQSGLVMYLEFPSKSNYVMKQMGPAFISSVLIILLLTIVFVIVYRFYLREKRNVERTREFLNTMTHEFKTPLANISFANNMLARNPTQLDSEKIQKYTEIIRSENDKIVKNSEDILEMAMQKYDLDKIEMEAINVHELLGDLKTTFLSTNPNISFNLNFGAKQSLVYGKTSFLSNALSNIIDNAIKYSKLVPEINISTSNDTDDKLLTIAIEDNGIGISKQNQKSVFDKFYRVSTGDQHDVKGFGLGLAYVKQIIEQMKGSISLKSDVGKGSVFVLKLPVSYAS